MRTTIGGIFRPDRHAFFAKLALSLLSQPAIKFRPAPLPGGGTGVRCQNMRKAAPHGSTRKREYGSSPARDTRKSPACVMAAKRKRNDLWSMKKLKLLSLIGITSIALANAGWAAGHGGGGGGFGGGGGSHGGGFGGGGFHGGGGGGFHGGALAAGHVGGGVGSRGGGVGFGGSRFSGGVLNFAGAGSRFSSFGRPSFRQPVN